LTPHESIAVELARHYGLRFRGFLRARAFEESVTAALLLVSESELVAIVIEAGGLFDARNPYAVLIARIGRIPEDLGADRLLFGELAETSRWRRVDAASRRGETLRALVERGDIGSDEAASLVRAEFTECEFQELALAALDGGRP
jgi:hypothetical protein